MPCVEIPASCCAAGYEAAVDSANRLATLDNLPGNQLLVEHHLFRKPGPIPDQVRDRLFRDHALTGSSCVRMTHRRLTPPMVALSPPRRGARMQTPGGVHGGLLRQTRQDHAPQMLVQRAAVAHV